MGSQSTGAQPDQDWSWVRWNRLRWDLVGALDLATMHPGDFPDVECQVEECCFNLASLLPEVGLVASGNGGRFDRFDHLEQLEHLVTPSMLDGLMMLSHFHRWKCLLMDNPLSGMQEIPQAAGPILHSGHFEEFFRPKSDDTLIDFDLIREFVYAMVSIALPDEYLSAVALMEDDDKSSSYSALLRGHDYVVPELGSRITVRLARTSSGFMSDEFRDVWIGMEAYDFGMLPWGDPAMSLRSCWNILPTVSSYFVHSERGNEAGVGMCFLTRLNDLLFVSQQVWEPYDESQNWNLCTKAFNDFLAPLAEGKGDGRPAGVVYSDFRRSAYIVSDIEGSWDDYAPSRLVSGPLPDGWGIVGVWDGYDSSRYTPRPLEAIIDANYSVAITASARYIQQCLASRSGRFGDL